MLIAFIVGVVVGLAGSFFALSIKQMTDLRNAYNWLIFYLPLGGIVIVLFYRWWDMQDMGSTNFILRAVKFIDEKAK